MSATITAVPAATWGVDPIHSSVGFAVKHLGVSTFRGGFADYSVTLDTTGETPSLRGVVQVESVETRLADLKGHLLSAEFFDIENTPQLTFTSVAFDVADDGTATVEGDLTIKGHTERVTATGTYDYVEADMGGGQRIGLELEAIVDRTKFGLNWNAPLPKGGFALANDVKLLVHLELVPSQA